MVSRDLKGARLASIVSGGLACVTLLFGLLLRPMHGSGLENNLTGFTVVFLGLFIFFYAFLEKWQTKDTIQIRGGGSIDYTKHRLIYNLYLVLFFLLSVMFMLYGAAKIFRTVF
jgi:hypothetical protein